MKGRLLERDAELAAVDAALAAALAGGGGLVAVTGAAGVGKTRLVDTASRSASAPVLLARGGELERDYALGIVRQLLEPPLAAATPAHRQELLAGGAGAAARVFEAVGAPSGEDFALLNGLFWLLAGVAGGEPLLVVVDDLHWADAPSLRFLDFLARRLAGPRIALLVALRPAERDAEAALIDALLGQPGAEVVELRPLSRGAVDALVHDRQPDASDALCAAYHEASGGNPLYLGELLRGGATDPDAVRRAVIPGLGERLRRRIATLGADAGRLADAAAVLGDGARLADVAALAAVAPGAAARAAQALADVEVLGGVDPIAFAHPVVRTSLHGRLTVTERAAAHRAAAELLAARKGATDAVAAHLLAIPPAGDARVAELLRAAAHDALGRGAPDAAAARLARAVEEGAESPLAAELLLELGGAQALLHQPAALGSIQAAYARAAGTPLGPRVAALLTDVLANMGLWHEAVAVVDDALAAVDREADIEVADDLTALRAIILSVDPAYVDQLDRDWPALVETARHDTWGARALAALLAHAAAMRGQGEPAVRPLLELALRDDRLVEERGAGAWASIQVAGTLLVIDDDDGAAAFTARIREVAERSGSVRGVVAALGYGSIVHARQGRLARGEADLRTAGDLCVQSGTVMWLITMIALTVDLLIERRGLVDLAALARDVEIPDVFARTVSGAMLLDGRGRIALAAGDHDAAAAALSAAGEIYRRLHVGPAETPWRSELARALHETDPARARVLAEEELELARRTGAARPEGVALRALGIVTGGEEGVGHLRASLDRLAGSRAVLETCRTQVELGTALRRLGRRREAQDVLAHGLDLAERSGAERLAARAEDELRAAGARPRRRLRTGPDALTASERRVAQLAAEGRSNVQIAQELYVGLKTVESHLSHAYAKLGLTGPGSRARLAEALAATEA